MYIYIFNNVNLCLFPCPVDFFIFPSKKDCNPFCSYNLVLFCSGAQQLQRTKIPAIIIINKEKFPNCDWNLLRFQMELLFLVGSSVIACILGSRGDFVMLKIWAF